MSTHPVPSLTRPGWVYDVNITDDFGIVCECIGYARKAEVSYRTGCRAHEGALCQHALQIAQEAGLAPRQPTFHWVDTTNGESFPVTLKARGPEEHMLAYWHNQLLEPLETATDRRFPRRPATPDRDYSGRLADVYSTPIPMLIIVTTGAVPAQRWSRLQIQQAIKRAGATHKRGAVTADTTVLVAGDNPAQSKLDRANELLTPVIAYASLMHILGATSAPPTQTNTSSP